MNGNIDCTHYHPIHEAKLCTVLSRRLWYSPTALYEGVSRDGYQLTRMVPNFAESQHEEIRDMIPSKLLTSTQMAEVAGCIEQYLILEKGARMLCAA
jgi:hypothetical protein